MERVRQGLDTGETRWANREHLFAKEAPETFTEAPAIVRGAEQDAGGLAVDPESGLLPEETLAMQEVAAGRVNHEAADALARAQEAEGLRQRMEDSGYAVMECIIKGVE